MVAKSEKKPAKKPKAKKPTPQQKAKLLDDKLQEMSSRKDQYADAVLAWEEAHAHAGELKKTMERAQASLNQVVQDVIDIRRGNFNPPLPFNGEQGQQVTGTETSPQVLGDDALTMKLDALIEFGMTEKKLDAVAVACDGNTIGALERFMREDRDWMKKCKGLGETNIDKLIDSLVAFRKKFPHPEPTVAEAPAEKPAEQPETPATASV